MRHLLATAATLIMLSASASFAGWHGLKFGDSESKAKWMYSDLQPVDGPEQVDGELRATLTMPYLVDSTRTDAYLYFDRASKLQKVVLEAAGKEACSKLLGIAYKTYGDPIAHDSSEAISRAEWHDELRRNAVSYAVSVSESDACSVTYEPDGRRGISGGL